MPAGGGYPLPVRTPNTPNSLLMSPTWSAQLQSSKNNILSYGTPPNSSWIIFDACPAVRGSASVHHASRLPPLSRPCRSVGCSTPCRPSTSCQPLLCIVPLSFGWLLHYPAPQPLPFVVPPPSASVSHSSPSHLPLRRAPVVQLVVPPLAAPPPLVNLTSHRTSLVQLVVAFPSTSASPSCRLRPAPWSAIHHTTSPFRRAHLTWLVVVTKPPPLVAHLSFCWLLHCPAPQPIVRMVVVGRVITLLPSVVLRLLPLVRESARRCPPP